MKLGEQIKCKIIPKINKLKVSKDEFNRLVSTNTDNIDYYYQSIMKHIEQQREKDQKDYGRIVKNVRIFLFSNDKNLNSTNNNWAVLWELLTICSNILKAFVSKL